MRSPPNDPKEFATWFQTGFADVSPEHPSHQTIRPEATATWTAGSQGVPATESLPTLPALTIGDSEDSPELVVMHELGRGGMGVVHLAQQASLDRNVAVKRVHDDVKAHVVDALIREARVMGLVEHPNVIPVHTMGMTEDGRPAVVMKRVEGTAWRNLVRESDHEGWSALLDREQDPIDDHIRVLLDVCRAVQFAHSRGILHRDLKPENVMLGQFGEVYVLDWGLAVTMEDGHATTQHLVGTPAYMAPEMLMAGQRIDVRTDVYLLGACLHEALTGRPRHTGGSLQEVLYAASASEPHSYPPDVPQHLADLCNRACAANPDDRPETVEAFRVSLLTFRRHRAALRLTERAEGHARQWAAATGFEADTLFSRARFGFQDAVVEWSENRRALQGLQGLLREGVGWQIASGNLDGAEASLVELQELGAAELEPLKAQLEEARRDLEALGQLRKDQDVEISLRTRVVVAGLLAVAALMVGLMILGWEALGFWELSFKNMIAVVLLVDVVLVMVLWVTRDALSQNQVNRNIRSILLIAGFSPLFNRVLGWIAGADPAHVLAVDLLLIGCCTAIGAMVLAGRWLWVLTAGFVLSAVIIAKVPSSAELVFTFVPLLAVALGSGVWFWQRRSRG